MTQPSVRSALDKLNFCRLNGNATDGRNSVKRNGHRFLNHLNSKWIESLHPERRHKLHTAGVAHAEDGPYRQRDRAHVGAGVALCVRGDISQGRARLLCGDKAHCGIESMVGQRAVEHDMRGGIGHDNGAQARRIPRGLINATRDSGGGQQRRFEIDSGFTGAGDLVWEPGGVYDLESAGECSLHWECKV